MLFTGAIDFITGFFAADPFSAPDASFSLDLASKAAAIFASSFFRDSIYSLKYFSLPSLDNVAIFRMLSFRCAMPSYLITSSRFSLFLVINLNSLDLEFNTVNVLSKYFPATTYLALLK